MQFIIKNKISIISFPDLVGNFDIKLMNIFWDIVGNKLDNKIIKISKILLSNQKIFRHIDKF